MALYISYFIAHILPFPLQFILLSPPLLKHQQPSPPSNICCHCDQSPFHRTCHLTRLACSKAIPYLVQINSTTNLQSLLALSVSFSSISAPILCFSCFALSLRQLMTCQFSYLQKCILALPLLSSISSQIPVASSLSSPALLFILLC